MQTSDLNQSMRLNIKSTILLALLISANTFSQDRTGAAEFRASRAGHTAKVVFKVSTFEPSSHKIEGLNPCNDFRAVRIDGRQPLGAGICHLPGREIRSMKIYFDKDEIEIPNELYSDCYEPTFPRLDSRIEDYLAVRIGDDMKSIFVFMNGGDGASHYQVLWVLRPDGKHSRFSTGACPDCSFINFDSGFDER
jgi:hypothetical protein